jgi:aspartate kinase
MEVFKFGGASVKDADAVKNVASILNKFKDTKKVVVISAMGKTTNALEDVVNNYVKKNEIYAEYLREIREYHQMVAEQLFDNNHNVYHKIHALFDKVQGFCTWNTSDNYTFIYDQIISVGELVSTVIVSEYLNTIGLSNTWVDARDLIRTDHSYTDARIEWDTTEAQVKNVIGGISSTTIITQGFIGSTSEKFTTTLGREGSDYTASILSYCLNATKMTIWKDVPGVLNADPKLFSDAVLIPEISYKEAVEMTYYGAKVIHPKTIRPIQNKQIPLHVKSFINPDNNGTVIGAFDENTVYPPIIVKMPGQVLLSFSVKDFSFVAEDSMSEIFRAFGKHQLRMNLMQNRAISFFACVDNKQEKIKRIADELKENFIVNVEEGLELETIRHYNQAILERETAGKNILLEQKARQTIQILYKI